MQTSTVQPIGLVELGVAATLVIALALITWRDSRTLSRSLLIAMVRLILQLALVALVLEAVFATVNPWVVGGLGLLMVLLAGREVHSRLNTEHPHRRAFPVATLSLFVSSFGVAAFALVALIRFDPWYHPQYAIPLLGMILGNSLNSVTLGLERLREGARHRRAEVEGRLMLGATAWQAISGPRASALRAALIPTINAMSAAGIVALPGMMTGQILAGSPPALAVKYQILIFLLIAASAGMGALIAIALGVRGLFDDRDRLQL
ncbi:iron export ABC transporter permease subunit FetB [Marinobacteraceae bacterium S3BR75-40.1]